METDIKRKCFGVGMLLNDYLTNQYLIGFFIQEEGNVTRTSH